MAKILIDGRFVGVGDSQTRYVLELVRNILKLDGENEYTLLIRPQGLESAKLFLGKLEIQNSESKTNSNDQNKNDQNISSFGLRASSFQNLKIQILDIPHYSVAEQTKLLKYLNEKKFDLVHFTQFNHPIFYRGDYVVTIQDLTLVGHLHYFNFIKQLAFNSVMKSAAKDSKEVIAISKVTEDDVIDFFGTPRSKFTLIYHGIDHERFNTGIKNKELRIKQFKDKYHIDGDYILYTGMWKKHKNLLRMLKAFEKLQVTRDKKQEKPLRLVLTGKIDKNEPEVITEIDRVNKSLDSKFLPAGRHDQIPNSINTTGFIDEDELPIAYAGAIAYCIPSLSEGFGWPPLEAMACGTPAIASDASCIPEILGDAALYFDPYNIDDIVAKMEDISKDEALRKSLISKGIEQVKKYSWEESARKTLGVYKKVLDR